MKGCRPDWLSPVKLFFTFISLTLHYSDSPIPLDIPSVSFPGSFLSCREKGPLWGQSCCHKKCILFKIFHHLFRVSYFDSQSFLDVALIHSCHELANNSSKDFMS